MGKRKSRAKAGSSSKEAPEEAKEVLARPSLAQHLPVEILSEIFLHSIPTSHTPFVQAATLKQWPAFFSSVFPMNLAVTSRSWRHAALNTRGLWSTCFIDLQGPTPDALAMLKCFLKHFVRRSGDYALKPHIRFAGSFDSVQACDSIGPLLECQDRWEDAEIRFGEAAEDAPGVALDITKLTSLQGLTVQGSSWSCIAVDLGIFDTDQPLSQNTPKLSSLRSAKLIDLPAPTYLLVLFAAPDLTELILHIRDDIEDILIGRPIVLPALRRLEFNRSRPGESRISLLQLFKVRVLEGLSVGGLSFTQQFTMFEFTEGNGGGLGVTLTSLRLRIFNSPTSQLGPNIILLLSRLQSLRSLEIHGDRIFALVAMLGAMSHDDKPYLCPFSEELVLGGQTGRPLHYTSLVRQRWNAPHRCIRTITFVDCEVSSNVGSASALSEISGVDTCVQEGLKLDFRHAIDPTA